MRPEFDLPTMLEHADWLHGLALALVRDGHEAEDVIQEALIEARGARAPKGVPTRAWLSGIVKNVARSRNRKERRRRHRDEAVARPEGSGPSALDDTVLMEQQRVLLDHIEALPQKQRHALLARFYGGLAPRKIAAAEGCPVSTIHGRIQRGIKSLRLRLDTEYGDRSTWAIWISPMLRVEAGATSAAGLGVAIGLVALAGLAAGAWWLASERPEGDRLTAGGTTRAGRVDARATNDARLLGSAAEHPATSQAARVAARNEVEVLVLRKDSREPVPGADVWILPKSRFEDDGDALMAIERTFLNESDHWKADGEGRVTLQIDPTAIVFAGDSTGLGTQIVEAGQGEAVVETTSAKRLVVRVLDQAGRTIDDGVSVSATARVHNDPDPRGNSNDHTHRLVHRVRNGAAHFQNPWAGYLFDGQEPVQHDWNKFSIDAVAIDAPGFGEFERNAVSKERFFPFQTQSGSDAVRTLTMPPHGSLRIEVQGPGGQPLPVAGTASLAFPGHRVATRWEEDYTVPIADGVAHWPVFVTGARAFRVRMQVLSHGSTWTVEGEGPRSEGEARIVRTRMVPQPTITARLLDPAGHPLELAEVALYLGRRQGNSVAHIVSSSSAVDGSVRFELRKADDAGPPYSILGRRRGLFSYEEALHLIEIEPADLIQGKDLGDITLDLQKPVRVRGQVTWPGGEVAAGAALMIHRPGRMGLGIFTDQEGRYESKLVLTHGSTIRIEAWDKPYIPQSQPLKPGDTDRDHDFVLSLGARFTARIDLGELSVPEGLIQLHLRDPAAARGYSLDHDQAGLFERRGLPPGTYSAALRFQGGQDFVTVTGLKIPASGEVTSAKINGTRLSDHLRQVEITWEGLPKGYEPQLIVRPVPKKRVDETVLISRSGGPYFLPRLMDCDAIAIAGNHLSVRIDDIAEIGETHHIRFPAPFKARITIVGTPDSKTIYSLRGEPDGPASGSSLTLSGAQLEAGIAEVPFSAPGTYRLYRGEKPVSIGGGAMTAAVPRATQATVELRGSDAGKQEFIATLRIDLAFMDR